MAYGRQELPIVGIYFQHLLNVAFDVTSYRTSEYGFT